MAKRISKKKTPKAALKKKRLVLGEGEMARRIAEFDWGNTPVGAVKSWSPALQMIVRFMLANPYPMLLWWGPEYVSIYNDAYRPVLGAKHPWALGQPVRECWKEIWHILKPLIDKPFKGGPATWNEDISLEINRHGFLEEGHFTIGYSPVADRTARGGIGGVLATVQEITGKVVGERRVLALRDLAACGGRAMTADEACAIAARTLAAHNKDLPFVLLYLVDEDRKRARLAGAAGVKEGSAISPEIVELEEANRSGEKDSFSQFGPHPNPPPGYQGRGKNWPMREALRGEIPQVVEEIGERFAMPPGSWAVRPDTAVVVPIPSNKPHEAAAIMVAGLNARLQYDAFYRDFVGLVTTQIATAISNARANEEERKRLEALAELDRAKTTFFSNVSHEFRTPLTLMLGPIEDALAEANVSEAQKERLEVAHRNSLRLLKLVNSMLDFARIEAGRVRASYEPMDLATFTTDIASTFRSAVERAGMTFTVGCAPMSQPAYLDRDMWEKIVLNLLSNAFKYTLQGGISVTLQQVGNFAELSVQDTGVGIPERELPLLFKRFHRVQGVQGRTHEGTGIGLALVQELLKLHGGSIGVESRLGEGTNFTVRLPLGSSHLPAEHIRSSAEHSPAALDAAAYVEEALHWISEAVGKQEAALGETNVDLPARSTDAWRTRGARIIIAEDNADMREYLIRLLKPLWKIEAVSDGRAALEAARRAKPDLILSDVMMPRLDGFELVKALRADKALSGVAIILLSARAGDEARVEGIEVGADDYLVKPFSARELLARVSGALALAQVRREGAESLRASEERFRAFVLASSDVVYRMSADWQELRFLEGRGFIADAPEPTRSWLEKYIHADDQKMVLEAIEKAIASRGTFELEHRVIRVDGTLGWAFSRAIPISGALGEIVEWFGAASDVTNLKRIEEERVRLLEAERSARVAAERSGYLKDEFLATLSHELRTPLNAILGWAQLLLRRQLDEELSEGLGVIERNSRAQSQLVEDLLDMSRIISGKLRINVQQVDLAEVIREAVESVQPSADARGVRLEVVLASDGGPVRGDPARLQQVVWNLLSNAVKFTHKGGKVQVGLERVQSHVEITITDNGMGIAAEFLPYVFERFRQADGTTTRKHGGLGLGLAIVKSIVEAHGGRIRAKSAGEGKGAAFTVELPLMIIQDDEPGEGKRMQRRGISRGKRGNRVFVETDILDGVSVLVVDDDKDARELIRRVLEDHKAKVQVAASATEGFMAFQRGKAQVILSDIGMPTEDGYEFIRKVRGLSAKEGGETPAAALTAFAHSEDRRRALVAGFQSHIAKPVEAAELVTVVASLAGKMKKKIKA